MLAKTPTRRNAQFAEQNDCNYKNVQNRVWVYEVPGLVKDTFPYWTNAATLMKFLF